MTWLAGRRGLGLRAVVGVEHGLERRDRLRPDLKVAQQVPADGAGRPASERARRRLSRTLIAETRCRFCSTMPNLRPRQRSSSAGRSESRSRPATRMRPRLGRSSPAVRCKSVLLPQPDGPSTRLWRPGATVQAAISRTVRPPKRWARSSTSSTAGRSASAEAGPAGATTRQTQSACFLGVTLL